MPAQFHERRSITAHITMCPRGLNRQQAASYVGLGESFFDKQIALGVYPAPIRLGSRKLWDKQGLDVAMDRLFAGTEIQVEEIVLQ